MKFTLAARRTAATSALLAPVCEEPRQLSAIALDQPCKFRALGQRHADAVDVYIGNLIDAVRVVSRHSTLIGGPCGRMISLETIAPPGSVRLPITPQTLAVVFGKALSVEAHEMSFQKVFELLPIGFARTAPVRAEDETGNAPQIEILMERPVEIGALLIRACTGADHLDSLVAEIPDEVVGTRCGGRPKRGCGCRRQQREPSRQKETAQHLAIPRRLYQPTV
jgi:hypothetical protein